ncbi:MAG TPA: hypothetical protein VGL72_19195 [Bryobacteraceae bacterium]
MKMGAEPKKMAVLGGLVAVAAIVYWMNSSDGPSPTASARSASAPGSVAMTPVTVPKVRPRRQPTGFGEGLGVFEPEAPATVDPTKVDPTIRLDLLAKVQSVESEGGVRNIFKLEQPPPEPVKLDPNIPKVPKLQMTDGQPKLPAVNAASTKPGTPGTPAAPVAPPINLKYYGYSTKRSDGEKKAFFLDGDDIIVAAEGDLIKKQYRVIRITTSSVQMEDTNSKSTQTLPLTPEAAPA